MSLQSFAIHLQQNIRFVVRVTILLNSFSCLQHAVRNNIPVVLPDWVDFVYDSAKNGSLSITDDCQLQDYIVPVFAGCVITASGFSYEVRMQISQIVTNNGGRFSGSMERADCTHLVINSNTGEKYRKAMEWKTVKVVTLKWLMKCSEFVSFGSNSPQTANNSYIFRRFEYPKKNIFLDKIRQLQLIRTKL